MSSILLKLKSSKNKVLGVLITKLGFEARMVEDQRGDMLWWWKVVWNLENLFKTRIFLWLSLKNKILTWDSRKKQN